MKVQQSVLELPIWTFKGWIAEKRAGFVDRSLACLRA